MTPEEAKMKRVPLPAKGTVTVRTLKKNIFRKVIILKIGKKNCLVQKDGIEVHIPNDDVEIHEPVTEYFEFGAFLCGGMEESEELTEEKFIRKAGGIEKLMEFPKEEYPYVTLILDKGRKEIIGHTDPTGRGIEIEMQLGGVEKFQTMEWK